MPNSIQISVTSVCHWLDDGGQKGDGWKVSCCFWPPFGAEAPVVLHSSSPPSSLVALKALPNDMHVASITVKIHTCILYAFNEFGSADITTAVSVAFLEGGFHLPDALRRHHHLPTSVQHYKDM